MAWTGDETAKDPLPAVRYFAERPSPEYDEVVLQADYCARATLSFWRFRQLGGGRRRSAASLVVGQTDGKGVHYVSDHPAVRIFNLSIIALLVLFESAANAYFFAQQSEFGLSGGIFQAAAVSLANVATSYFIIGFWGLRHITVPMTAQPWLSRENVIKVFAVLAIIGGGMMALLVNLSAAHYRNILDLAAGGHALPDGYTTKTFSPFFVDTDVCNVILSSELGQTIGAAATNAMCRPFALHSLDAMVLFALGLAISAIAAFEGRRADSPFPGFSDAARSLERARRDLQDALEDYYDSYDDVISEARKAYKAHDQALSLEEELALRQILDHRVDAHRSLLTSDPDLLRDEFDVPGEAVVRITGRPTTQRQGQSQ